MSKYRTEPRYNVADAIQVHVGEFEYYVFLDVEVVVKEVRGKNGKMFFRRVTNREIETSAILRASGKFYDGIEG